MSADPESLNAVLLRPEEGLAIPVDFKEVFSRSAPLALEIGFGAGESLVWWSARHPEWNILGVEFAQEGVSRAARSLHRAGRENVRIFHGDVRTLLRECIPAGSLHRVLMQFPMPWPKERHAKNRVNNPAFVASLAHVLEVGGRFELVTDQVTFAQDCQRSLQGNPAFQVSEIALDPSREFRTRYEKKWLEDGRSIFCLTAILEKSVPLPQLCAPQPMLHQHIPHLPSDAEIQALAGRAFRLPGMAAEIKACYRGEQCWMLHAVTADESFSQFVWVRLSLRDDRAVLKVGDQPRPYATPAVKFLLDQVAAALSEKLTLGK